MLVSAALVLNMTGRIALMKDKGRSPYSLRERCHRLRTIPSTLNNQPAILAVLEKSLVTLDELSRYILNTTPKRFLLRNTTGE